MILDRSHLLVGICALLVLGCGHARPQRVDVSGRVEVWRMELSYSNVHVVRSGKAAVLVDAGSPGDLDALGRVLGAIDLSLSEIRLVVLTHGHGDHAGMGRALQAKGIPIMVGAGDEAMTRVGHNDDLKSQNLTGWFLKPFVDLKYEAFSPNEIVDTRRTLAPWGLPFVEVERLPGHTPGSLVVTLPRGDAIVGDMILGGWFGGAMFADTPGGHYYQADSAQNRRNIATLLGRGVQRFHVGHGGPVEAAAVRAAFGE